MLKIYTINNCPWCKKVKHYLDQKNVEYKEYNIEEDENARLECKQISGGLTVPVLTDGKKVAVSFQKSIIDCMIDS